MLTHWIWFAHRPGVSDRLKAVLMEHFCDPEDIFYADEAALRGLPELSREALEGLLDKNLTSSEEILEACDRKQLQILTYQDAGYPARLKNIPDPPMVLYYKGRLPEFDAYPTVGIVGTRKASAYGLTAAKKGRGNGLYAADASALFKRAEKNPVVTAMLSDFGPQWCHDHLHVHYGHS